MRRYSPILGPVLGLLLLALAVFVLYHKLSTISFQDIKQELRDIETVKIVAAIILTALYYFLATAYDTLSFSFIGLRLPYRRIALASFTGYAFSHNIGLSFISSSSVRYRIHSSFGLSARETAKVVVFSFLSFWIGFLTVSSTIFLLLPIRVPPSLHLPFHSVSFAGYVGVAILMLYGWYTMHARHGHSVRGIELPKLTPKIFVLQMLIGSLDWLLASSILFVLLPDGIVQFPRLFEIFVLAHIAGIVSQVPGGIGVFEGVVVTFLHKVMPVPAIVGLLIIYRLIMYILPLLIATALLATHEVRVAKSKHAPLKWLSL